MDLRCSAQFNGEHGWATPHLMEEKIKRMVRKANNEGMSNRERVIVDCGGMLEFVSDYKKLDALFEKANERIARGYGLVSVCVRENAVKAQAQDTYIDRFDCSEDHCMI